MKKFIRQMMTMAIVMFLFLAAGVRVSASEQDSFTILKMVKTIEAVDAKIAPEDTAEVFKSFEEGSDLLVVEETDSEWYGIVYQGEIAYVKQASTAENSLFGEEQQVVEEEIAEVSEETTVLAETLEREQTDTKRTLIWGLIIAILIIGIMAVSVLGKIKEDKEKQENMDTESNTSEKEESDKQAEAEPDKKEAEKEELKQEEVKNEESENDMIEQEEENQKTDHQEATVTEDVEKEISEEKMEEVEESEGK